MLWKLVEKLTLIKDFNVRARTFQAQLDDTGREELARALQRTNDWRILLVLKIVYGDVDAALLSDFGVWLVLQGRVAYERALADPDTLADFPEIGRTDVAGRFKFKEATRGAKWPKKEARRRLPRLMARYRPVPPPDPREALVELLRALFASGAPQRFGDTLTLEPKTVHDIRLVTLTPGPRFDTRPAEPEVAALWERMREIVAGEPVWLDGIGTLSKTERAGFTAYDAELGHDRTVPSQTVWSLRVDPEL
ncbi:MAG: DUF4240 domain-containing protein [Myxococcota bacterium]